MWTSIKAVFLGTYLVAASLMDEVSMGNHRTVSGMIRNGANANYENPTCYTLLMKAVESWNSDIVLLLIRNGALLNKRSCPNGYTALHLATMRVNTQAVGYLARHGADLDLGDKYGKTALMIAAENGLDGIAAILIDYKAKVDLFDMHGFSALTGAAKNGHTGIVSRLLDAGADPNSSRGLSALHYTAIWGRTATMSLLISRGAKIDNELIFAVRFGHADAASVLIANGATVTRDALMEALKNGNNELISMLILAGADTTDIILPNDIASRIRIPPFVSVARLEGISSEFRRMEKQSGSIPERFRDLFRGWDEARLETVFGIVFLLKVLDCEKVSFHHRVAPFLVEEDSADLVRLSRFHVVLSFLASTLILDENFVKQFFKQMMRRSAVVKVQVIVDAMYAAYKQVEEDNVDKVTLFAERLNAKFFRPARLIKSAARKIVESKSLLMKYASAGNTQGVMNAIAQGSPVNQVMKCSGETPLTLAAERGHTNVVGVLIEYGAEVDHEAVRSGGSALEVAAARGFVEIVSLLIQNNADVHRSSATIEAARNGHTGVVSMLLDEGVDVNYKVKKLGCSALMLATANGHLETIKFLLSKGADISAVSNDGYTPLMFAVRSGLKESASFLIASGADVNQLTTRGVALHLASRGAREMIKMLIHAGAVVSKINSDFFFSSEIAPIILSWFPARGSDIPPRFDVMIDAFLLKLDEYPLHLFNKWSDESRMKRVSLIIAFLVKLDCQELNFYLFAPFLAESDVSSLNKFGVVLKFLLAPLESDILQADRKEAIVSFNIKTLNETLRNAVNVRPKRIVEAMFTAYTEVNAEMAILKRAMRTIPDVHIGGVLRFANGPFGIYSKFAHSLHISME